jgi:predicted nucleic acid-binding protein
MPTGAVADEEVRCADRVGRAVALRAVQNQRTLPSGGIAVPKTVDASIATVCTVNDHRLLHADTDVGPLQRHSGHEVLGG